MGSVVVLLHGFLENSTMWNDVIPFLSKNNRVITIDLLGHGGTESLSYVHSMEDQAAMIKSLLNSLRLRRFILIGHSLGGYIALAFANLFPNSIKKLCLVNATALPDTLEKQVNRDRAILMVKRNKDLFIKIAIPNLFTLASKTKFKNEIEIVKREALKTSLQGVIASLEGMKIRKNNVEVLKNNLYDKILIIGKKDPLLNYESLIKQTKNTNTKIIEFSNGHMSHIENFEELVFNLMILVKPKRVLKPKKDIL